MSVQRSENYTLDLYIHTALKDLVNKMKSMYGLIYTLILGLSSMLISLKVFLNWSIVFKNLFFEK